MSKNNIAQQYNSMVASIEDAKIYDGRGEYNLYECNKCNNYKVTLYKDKGVTDLDPCAPMHPLWPTAKTMYNKQDNGLIQNWGGANLA